MTETTIKWGTTKKERQARRLAEVYEQRRALEAQEQELKAEAELNAKAVKQAVKDAGFARSAAVQELYERFGIEEITTERTKPDGSVVPVRSDKNEDKRTGRLLEVIGQAMAELEELRSGKALVPDESSDEAEGQGDGEETSDGDEGDDEVIDEGTGGADDEQPESVEDRDAQGWSRMRGSPTGREPGWPAGRARSTLVVSGLCHVWTHAGGAPSERSVDGEGRSPFPLEEAEPTPGRAATGRGFRRSLNIPYS